jgi:hypothetical protein
MKGRKGTGRLGLDTTRTKKQQLSRLSRPKLVVSRLSGSRLKWRLDQMRLGSARIGAAPGSSSSRQLAGAAETLTQVGRRPREGPVSSSHFFGV